MTEAQAMLDHLCGQLDALLGAFEPEGMAVAESLSERLEASRGRLEAFLKGAALDVVQDTMGLVKSHFPDCSEADWEANHANIQDISKRIMADLNL